MRPGARGHCAATELRVLYTTGNAPTTEMKSLFVDGQHFLPKPYTPDQLHESVVGMLAT